MSKIPTKLTEKQFVEHIDPYLSQAKRGCTGHIPRYKVFNYILYWLHTGCQWEEIPIASVPGSEKKKSAIVPFTFTSLTGATMVV
jgi:transposase